MLNARGGGGVVNISGTLGLLFFLKNRVGGLAGNFVGVVSGASECGFLSTDALGVLLDAVLCLSACLACVVSEHRGLAAFASC